MKHTYFYDHEQIVQLHEMTNCSLWQLLVVNEDRLFILQCFTINHSINLGFLKWPK